MRRRQGWAMWVVLVGSGCAAVRPAVPPAQVSPSGGFVYENGWGSRIYPVGPEIAESAGLEALNDLRCQEMQVRDETPDGLLAQGKTPDGRALKLLVRPVAGGTQVAVQVGRFGERAFTTGLIDRVGVRLGLMTAPSVPEGRVDPSVSTARFDRTAVPDAVMLREQGGSPFGDMPIP